MARRRRVDWVNAKPLIDDVRPDGNGRWPLEYLVEWKEEGLTESWEPLENLLNVKDMVRRFDERQTRKNELKKKREEKARRKNFRKSEKAQMRGTLEKNILEAITGIKKDKESQELLARVEWKE